MIPFFFVARVDGSRIIQVLWEWWLVTTTMENHLKSVPDLKRMYHISGQITIIPKPELKGVGCGGSPHEIIWGDLG